MNNQMTENIEAYASNFINVSFITVDDRETDSEKQGSWPQFQTFLKTIPLSKKVQYFVQV